MEQLDRKLEAVMLAMEEDGDDDGDDGDNILFAGPL